MKGFKFAAAVLGSLPNAAHVPVLGRRPPLTQHSLKFAGPRSPDRRPFASVCDNYPLDRTLVRDVVRFRSGV